MKKLVIGILAHVDAGKTTLSEALLYQTGAIRSLGRVDHKDAFLDTEALERERGITIFSKQAVFPLGEAEAALLDTPGHVDFSAEMERTLQVMDCAILVISGTDGVQAHTRTLWQLLEGRGVPVFLFINKMDLVGGGSVERAGLLSALRAGLGEGFVDFSGPREALLEENFFCSPFCSMATTQRSSPCEVLTPISKSRTTMGRFTNSRMLTTAPGKRFLPSSGL